MVGDVREAMSSFMPKKNTNLSHGQRLRYLRKQQGMTLQDVADKSGLSPSLISLVERRKTIPSILSLYNLARALEVEIGYFFTPPDTGQIFHSGKNPKYLEIDSLIKYIPLAAPHPGQQMDAYIFEIPPGPSLPQEGHRGECFYHQLSGSLIFTVEDELFTMVPGDSLHFTSEHGFTLQNRSEELARVLWVGTPVLFPNEGSAKT